MPEDSDKIARIKVVKPDVREDTITRLEQALAEAKRGEIREIFLLGKTYDGWRELASPTNDFSGWIGRLEVTKYGWLRAHRLAEEAEQDKA